MNDRWTLRGKRALVTGGSKGIGAAVATELATLGAEVVIVARKRDDIEALVRQGRQEGLSINGMSADLSQSDGLAAIIDYMDQNGRRLDILVNNAGMNIRKKTPDYTAEEYELIMNTNLRPVWELSRRLQPLLKESSGCIVNIASVAGLVHVRSGSIYGMSKAAVIQLGRNLACEWAADGIRVNTVAPWYIRTPLAEQVLKDPEYSRSVLARTPLGRLGMPQDVAAAVVFLCLPAAGWITGQCLAVDGGFSALGF